MVERPPPLEWLTVAEVADELGLNVVLVRVLIHDQGLPAVRRHGRVGEPWMVERQMLERWLRQASAATGRWVVEHPRGGDAMWNTQTGAHF